MNYAWFSLPFEPFTLFWNRVQNTSKVVILGEFEPKLNFHYVIKWF